MKRIPSTIGFQNEPTGLYNSMIHPLRNYGIRGIIWYQGESDTGPEGSKHYERHLIDLVNDWRTQWNNKNCLSSLCNLRITNKEAKCL